MRLTKQTDYALRVLMHLAVNSDRLNTIPEMAQRYGISRAHLTKVVHALSQAGFVETVRGHLGGMQLARLGTEIRVGDVVRRMEGEFALVECQRRDGGNCLITPCCRLKPALAEAIAAFLKVLDGYTLAQLTENNTDLFGLLQEDAA